MVRIVDLRAEIDTMLKMMAEIESDAKELTPMSFDTAARAAFRAHERTCVSNCRSTSRIQDINVG